MGVLSKEEIKYILELSQKTYFGSAKILLPKGRIIEHCSVIFRLCDAFIFTNYTTKDETRYIGSKNVHLYGKIYMVPPLIFPIENNEFFEKNIKFTENNELVSRILGEEYVNNPLLGLKDIFIFLESKSNQIFHIKDCDVNLFEKWEYGDESLGKYLENNENFYNIEDLKYLIKLSNDDLKKAYCLELINLTGKDKHIMELFNVGKEDELNNYLDEKISQ